MNTQQAPRVSIVIPTYNRAAPLRRALESVFAQTYTDYEILVIDDGSTDGTAEEIADLMDRIHYLPQENRGVSAARNKGIDAARGDLIAFLDSDDEWLPTKLEQQVAYLDAHPDVAFLACHAVGETHTFSRESYVEVDQFQRFLTKPFPQNMSRYVARRDCFTQHGQFDRSLNGPEDWEFWLRLLKNGCRFDYIDEPLIRYYDSPDAISRRPQKMLSGELAIKQRYVDSMTSCWSRCWIGSKFLARSYFCAALSYRELGEPRKAWNYVLRSLWANPFWPQPRRRLAFLASLCCAKRKPVQEAKSTSNAEQPQELCATR